MSILSKVALNAVKKTADKALMYAAVDIAEGNNKTFNNAVNKVNTAHAEKVNIKADGRIVISIGRPTGKSPVTYFVYDSTKSPIYRIEAPKAGKAYTVYDNSNNVMATIKCSDQWKAHISANGKRLGYVNLKVGLKGPYYDFPRNNWRIETTLTGGRKKYIHDDEVIAETSMSLYDKDFFILYISHPKDIQHVLFTLLATQAIGEYRDAHINNKPTKNSSSKEKRDKNSSSKPEKKKKDRSKWFDDGKYVDMSYDSDDDD